MSRLAELMDVMLRHEVSSSSHKDDEIAKCFVLPAKTWADIYRICIEETGRA